MFERIFIALAGVMGAAGVGLAAASAHSVSGAGLDSAAYLLLIHACAVVAVTVATHNGLTLRPLADLATWGFIAGAALFAGDIALRAYTGQKLFPMAAPIGGTVMLLAWPLLSLAALFRRR